MEAIFVILTVLCLFFVIRCNRPHANRVFLYIVGGYVCFWLVISLFNPYDLYPVSLDSYFILFMGFSSFFLGFIEIRQQPIRSNNHPLGIYSYHNKISLFLNNRKFVLILLFCFIFLAYLATTQWQLLLIQGGAGDLKLDFFELIFNSNSALYLLYELLVFPFFHFCCILIPILVLNKKDRVLALYLLLYILLFAFVGGKRGYFATIIQYFIVVFFLVKYKELKFGITKWIKYLTLGALIIFPLVVGAAYMTSIGRNDIEGSKEGLVESTYENARNLVVYNIGSFRAFDHALENDFLQKAGGYTYGRNFLGGAIDYYGCPILQKVGIPIKRVREGGMSLLQNNSIMIGKDTEFNFLYTALLYFYFDAGILGVLFLPFLFGRFCLLVLRIYNRYRTVGSLCLVAYLIIESLLLNGSWFNISLSAQPTLLLFYLMHRYEKKKIWTNNKVYQINTNTSNDVVISPNVTNC